MVSSQTGQQIEGLDEVIRESDADFPLSGLKTVSVIRVGRLAVVEGARLIGPIGEIEPQRLRRLKSNLAGRLTKSEAEKNEA